jgi:hypothetical protein
MKERLGATRTAAQVRMANAPPRPQGAGYTVSSSGSHTAVLLGFALLLVGLGLVLLGWMLGTAEILWWQPAELLVEKRGELTFAGLGILGCCTIVALLILFAS